MADQVNYLQQLVNIIKQQGSKANAHAQTVLQNAQNALAAQATSATQSGGQSQTS